MNPGVPIDFQASLQAELPAIVDDLARVFAAQGEALPWSGDEVRGPAARKVCEAFFVAMQDGGAEEIRRLLRAPRLAPRTSPEAVHAAVALLHGLLIERAQAAAEAGAPGVWACLSRMAAAIGLLSVEVAADFERQLNEAHAERKASEERYRRFFERAPAVMHAMDADFRILAVSDRWLEELGYTREEVLGTRTDDYLTEETRQRARGTHRPDYLQRGIARDIPYQWVRKDGEVRDFLASAVVERDEEGRIREVVAALVDVTERLRAERALRESEARYRILVEQSPLAFLVHRSGTVLYANPAAVSLLAAKSAAEIVGMPVIRLVHPDLWEITRERMRAVQEEGKVAEALEERVIRLDGSMFYADVSGTPIPYDGGMAVQVTFADVTARRLHEDAQREAALREERIQVQERMLRELSTPLIPVHDGILVMPLVGGIDEARAARIMETLLGGITAHGASHAIVDVTGVPEAQEGAVEGLLRAAQAARLLGAELVLTGLRASLARTLAEAAAALAGIATQGTLQGGVAYALRKRGRR